jgi:two-component system, cell cycle sensor histidine kinase and response regulator CckA
MAGNTKIILVDDEPEILEMLHGLLKSEGYTVRCARNGDEAIRRFKRERADIVVTDLRMPGMGGLEVLRAIKAIDSSVEVIVLTGHASIDAAISALKSDGAFDFLTKPLDQLDDFLITIEKAIAHRNLILENTLLLEELSQQQINLEAYNKELRQTKRALELSRYRYQDLYHQAPVGYLTINGQGEIQEANQTSATLFRMSKAKICDISITELIFPEDLEAFNLNHSNFMDSIPYASEIRMIRSNGEVFHAHLENLAILKKDGSVDQVRITIYDITSKIQIELALKESEQRYRSFVQNFKGIAFRIDADGAPVFYHGAVEETTGYSESELMRNRPGWETLIHPDELELVQSRRRILSASQDRNITHEYRIRHRNRQWRWVREHIQSLHDSQAHAYILHGVIFDITDHKLLQAQYVESRKLDAIATMAAGIAHQFNNSLSGLMGNLELMEMDEDFACTSKKYSNRMMEMIQDMTQLTSQLLAYARGGKYMPSKLSAHEMVRQSINLVEHRLSEKYNLNMQLRAKMDQIVADSTQMQIMILAVMENAIEAMGEGGIISIKSRTVEMQKETVKGGYAHAPGRYICLSFHDNGCGMPKATAEKIFDPFFTTKFIGRGLGLSAAYGIVVNHNGWMEVDTKITVGTEMRIFLPLTDSPVVAAKEGPDIMPLSKGNATILVVEDEEMVMKAIHELLERLEYRVIEANTGHKALDLLKTNTGQIDVVLLDVRLPDLEAMDLYKKMTTIRPDLKVIVCSGYNQDGPVEQLLASGANAFLQKPFSVSRLSSELRSAIENNTPKSKVTEKELKAY